jgi:hypothetical protein
MQVTDESVQDDSCAVILVPGTHDLQPTYVSHTDTYHARCSRLSDLSPIVFNMFFDKRKMSTYLHANPNIECTPFFTSSVTTTCTPHMIYIHLCYISIHLCKNVASYLTAISYISYQTTI